MIASGPLTLAEIPSVSSENFLLRKEGNSYKFISRITP